MKISRHGAGNGQRIISTVQVGVLGIAVIVCAVLLLRGDPGPGHIYLIRVVFFGISFLGHLTFLIFLTKPHHPTWFRTPKAPE
jgi:type VI protein secretion system component VasK